MDESGLKIFSLLAVALVGGGVVFLDKIKRDKWFKLLVSFSGAYLLGMIFVHLSPFVFQGDSSYMGLLVMAGFLLQVVLEYFSEGVEHGHLHHHNKAEKGFPILVMISLCIHALVEGMPLAASGHDHGDSLLIGILVHKLPVAFVLVTILLDAGLSKTRTLIYLLIFASMSPLGLVLQEYLMGSGVVEDGELMIKAVTAILIGILLHVSTTILFESSDGHKFNLLKFVGILIGFLFATMIF